MNPLTHYNQNTPGALILLGGTVLFTLLAARAFLHVPRHYIWGSLATVLATLFGFLTYAWCTFRMKMF